MLRKLKRSLNIFVVHASDMLTDHLPYGEGWIAYNQLKGLTERGHTVYVAVPRIEIHDPVPPRMHLYVTPKPAGILGRLLYVRAARNLLKDLRSSVHFDIIHQFSPVETGLSLGVSGMGIPLVLGPYPGYWPAGAFDPPQPSNLVFKVGRFIRDSFALLQQMQASALIITCPAANERIVLRGKRHTQTCIISPGINNETYPSRSRVPQKRSILFLANLDYHKGIFTLLEAFDRVAAAIADASLEIWGESAIAEAVDRRIAQSPFRDRISRRGRAAREKVGEIMRSHSVYCLPSYGEPFGMTLLEAMASGLPIVTTNVGGPPFIIHEAGGRVVPMRDTERLADALVEILSSVELQESMGAYNRKRVEQEFSWTKSIDRLESVYDWVLSK